MRRYQPVCLAPLLLAACYTYTPIESGVARPGASVRARVTPSASGRIGPLIGATDARLVIGTLVENNDGALIVEVATIVPADAGTGIQALHQRVSIARSDLVELETRTLDRARTAAVTGAAVIVVGGGALRSFKGNGSSEGQPTGGSTDLRISLLRLAW